MERQRKNWPKGMTERDVQNMDLYARSFHRQFMRTLAPHMPSNANANKYHKQAHVPDCTLRLGQPQNYSAQFFEAEHERAKHLYRHAYFQVHC